MHRKIGSKKFEFYLRIRIILLDSDDIGVIQLQEGSKPCYEGNKQFPSSG